MTLFPRIVALSLFSFVVLGSSFGQLFPTPPPAVPDFGPNVTNAEALALIEVLDDKTWNLAPAAIRDTASKLPTGTRYFFYERYKIAGTWGLLNIYGGAGSFIQGDPGTGAVGLLALGVYGGSLALTNLPNSPSRNIWITTGAAVAIGAFVYSMIRPWFFADEKNRSLKSLLFQDAPATLKNP